MGSEVYPDLDVINVMGALSLHTVCITCFICFICFTCITCSIQTWLKVDDTSRTRKGVGSQTLEFALKACCELNIRALHLEVEPMNAAGLALYRKFGFED